MLEQELRTFEANLTEWLKRHEGRYVLIKETELIGVFNTFEDALTEGTKQFGLAPFLIRQVKPDTESVYLPALTLGVLNAPAERPTERHHPNP